MKKQVLLVGTFPPPVHGMAAANQAVLERLEAEDWSTIRLDTAPQTLNRNILARLGRFPKVLYAWYYLIKFYLQKKNRKTVTYLALSGGWGQIYDLVTVFLCKMMGVQLVMHHHSFFYLDNYRYLSNFTFKIAGKRAEHVVLCKKMRETLQSRYQIKKVMILSNVVLFPITAQPEPRYKLKTIGYLSNITHEKGGDIAINLARSIKKNNLPLKVLVAGPCHDVRLESELSLASDENLLQWTGAVYGKDKVKFWEEIDVFIFPTQYQNEAEPLVLWEALAAGVPIIAYNRGCIAEQISVAGLAIQMNDNFVDTALPILESWVQNQEAYLRVVGATKQYYSNVTNQHTDNWNNFKRLLSNV